jgi:hypothetical protein
MAAHSGRCKDHPTNDLNYLIESYRHIATPLPFALSIRHQTKSHLSFAAPRAGIKSPFHALYVQIRSTFGDSATGCSILSVYMID